MDHGGRDARNRRSQLGRLDFRVGGDGASIADRNIPGAVADGDFTGARAVDADIGLGHIPGDGDVHVDAGQRRADAAQGRVQNRVGRRSVVTAESQAANLPGSGRVRFGIEGSLGQGNARQCADAQRAGADIVNLDPGVRFPAALNSHRAGGQVLRAQFRAVGAVGNDHGRAGVDAHQARAC